MNGEIEYALIKPEDRQEVVDFLLAHYIPEEPLNIGVDLPGPDPEELKYCANQLKYGLSIKAVLKIPEQKDQIVGVSISGPKDRNEANNLDAEVKRLGPTKWGLALKFLAFVERQANVFDRYNVEKVLHSNAVAVNKEMRGRNIGYNMKRKVEELGKSLGFEMKTADCTSFYSARLLDRMGYDCVCTIYYKDYKDENGEQVYHMPPPHDACRSYAIRL